MKGKLLCTFIPNERRTLQWDTREILLRDLHLCHLTYVSTLCESTRSDWAFRHSQNGRAFLTV